MFIILLFSGCFFKKSFKTAVLDDGRPPGALVLTKLIEPSRLDAALKKNVLFKKQNRNGGLSGNGGHHRLRHATMLRVHGFEPICGVFVDVLFSKMGQNGAPRWREATQSASFEKTKRRTFLVDRAARLDTQINCSPQSL